MQTAKKHPEEFGLPLSRWTLRRLSETLNKLGVVVSHQPVRIILIKNGIRFKKSKSYIQSPDPLYAVKKKWFYLPKGSGWLNPVEAEQRIFKKLYLPLFESK